MAIVDYVILKLVLFVRWLHKCCRYFNNCNNIIKSILHQTYCPHHMATRITQKWLFVVQHRASASVRW